MKTTPLSYPFLSVQRLSRSSKADPTTPRDVLANDRVCKALHKLGYGFGEPIINHPPDQLTREHLPESRLLEIDLSHVRPEDVIVATTRPAMHDHDAEIRVKKWLEPGNTTLERMILHRWSDYVDWLSRSDVALNETVSQHLSEGFENRSRINFRQKCSSFYYKLSRLREPLRLAEDDCRNATVGFVLNLAELWPGGPGLVHAFGMSAISTLVLCNHLYHESIRLLETPGFFMLELVVDGEEQRPARPQSLDWTLEWKVKTILSYA